VILRGLRSGTKSMGCGYQDDDRGLEAHTTWAWTSGLGLYQERRLSGRRASAAEGVSGGQRPRRPGHINGGGAASRASCAAANAPGFRKGRYFAPVQIVRRIFAVAQPTLAGRTYFGLSRAGLPGCALCSTFNVGGGGAVDCMRTMRGLEGAASVVHEDWCTRLLSPLE
jgi:hypothetical protein